MSEHEELIKSQGTPKQQETLNYYLQQIAIQRLKEEKDITAYKAKKEKQLDRLREDNKRLDDRYEQRMKDLMPGENLIILEAAQCLVKINNNLSRMASLVDETAKEIDRRRDHYQTKVRWFLLKIEALAKKVKLG